MVRDVTALSELDNLSLSFLFFNNSKGRVRKVQILLGINLVATCPADHVHETTFITVTVGNAECVNETMLERRERFGQTGIEGLVQSK